MSSRARVALAALVVAAACAPDDASSRRDVDPRVLRKLEGSWDVTLTAEQRAALGTPASAVGRITGTMAFTPVRHGGPVAGQLGLPTHEGVYDVDFRPFGWSASTDAPIAFARVVDGGRMRARSQVDSLYVTLDPDASRFSVRLAGVLRGDSATGIWQASAYRAGGASGEFVLRRRAPMH